MKKAFVFAVLAAFMAGCAAPYAVTEDTDKFSDPSKPLMVSLKGNNIDFRDPMGSVKSSELDPFVSKDRATHKVISTGFFFVRSESGSELAFGNAPKWLAIQPGDEMVFIADGERVVAKAISGRFNGEVTTAGWVDTNYYDYGTFTLAPADFKKVALAKTLEFKVSGHGGVETWPRTNRKYLDSFQANLQRFYNEQIAPGL